MLYSPTIWGLPPPYLLGKGQSPLPYNVSNNWAPGPIIVAYYSRQSEGRSPSYSVNYYGPAAHNIVTIRGQRPLILMDLS